MATMAVTPVAKRSSLSVDLMGSPMSVCPSNLFHTSSGSLSASVSVVTPIRDADYFFHDQDDVDEHEQPIILRRRPTPASPRSSGRMAVSPLARPTTDPGHEEEKRQDNDCVSPCKNTQSSRSPIAILTWTPSKISSRDGDHQREQMTPNSYKNSLASSMFLVSPLRPLTARSKPRIDTREVNTFMDFKAALIDSSESFLRPLTPPNHKHHKPKRSMSDANLLKDIDDYDEAESDLFTSNDQSTMRHRRKPFTTTTTELIPNQRLQQQATTTNQNLPQNQKLRWLIPAEHPCKIAWDFVTFILSFVNAYKTHAAIRDRQFGGSTFMSFCQVWFLLDILLNFITEYRSDNYALRDCRSVWARYLTTWFVVDILSLFPGEALYVRPIIEVQNRRGFFTKNFFRTRAVVRVTRFLRGHHFKMFGTVATHSKHAGVGRARLIKLLIKYIPKYLLFFRNMKFVIALRVLRQYHWFRKVWRNLIGGGESPQEKAPPSLRNMDYDDDDDGAPF